MTTNSADEVNLEHPATKTITPRRGLPSGRAFAGALLITIAAIGSFAIATSGNDGPTTSYLVVSRNLRAGEALTANDVIFEPMTLSAELATRVVNSIDGIDGAVTVRDLAAGSLLELSDVIGSSAVDGEPIGEVHELTFGVPLERSPASLKAGDRVTILATFGATTVLAVEDVPVLSIDTQPEQIASSGRGILTLAVDDPVDVMDIAHLTQVADITIVRSTRALNDEFPDSVSTPIEVDP